MGIIQLTINQAIALDKDGVDVKILALYKDKHDEKFYEIMDSNLPLKKKLKKIKRMVEMLSLYVEDIR